MENDHIRTILNNIENGTLTASEAYAQLKLAPFEDLGYAKVDHHREVRQGAPEVIYGASKTKEQIEGITNSLLAGGADIVEMNTIRKRLSAVRRIS